jgi:hypothetical protein
MAKNRSTSRSRSLRSESGRTGGSMAGSRYDVDDRSGYNREPDYERGGNGGYHYDEEYGGEHRLSFVKRVGNKFSEMDLEKAMVLLHTALAVAIVIKQSRDRNRGRKGEPFRSAVSVLNHYLNDGGGLSDSQRATLEDIKEELRALYQREDDEMMSPSRG